MIACLVLLLVIALLAVLAASTMGWYAPYEGATCAPSARRNTRAFREWILSLGEENFHGGSFTSWFSPNKLDGKWDWYPHLTGTTYHQPTKFTLRWNEALNRIQMIPHTGGRAWLARWASDHRLVIDTGALGPVEAQVFQTPGCTTPRILSPIGSFTQPVYFGYP